jgi:hypothetical protein
LLDEKSAVTALFYWLLGSTARFAISCIHWRLNKPELPYHHNFAAFMEIVTIANRLKFRQTAHSSAEQSVTSWRKIHILPAFSGNAASAMPNKAL